MNNACPRCHRLQPEWTGAGFATGSQRYCCQGCAELGVCQCAMAQSTPAIDLQDRRNRHFARPLGPERRWAVLSGFVKYY